MRCGCIELELALDIMSTDSAPPLHEGSINHVQHNDERQDRQRRRGGSGSPVQGDVTGGSGGGGLEVHGHGHIQDVVSVGEEARAIGSDLPLLPLAGMGLGAEGFAATLANVGKHHSVPGMASAALVFHVLAGLCLLAVAARAVLHPRTVAWEHTQPGACAKYAVWSMGLALLAHYVAAQGSAEAAGTLSPYTVGKFGIWLATVVMLAELALFTATCVRRGAWPEPFWFPPTVGCAMIGLTGASIGMNQILVDLALASGLVACVVLVPPVLYRLLVTEESSTAGGRTLATPTTTLHAVVAGSTATVQEALQTQPFVAPNASVAILAAPIPLVTVSWFAVGGLRWIPKSAHIYVERTLLVSGAVVLVVTL